MLYYSFVAQSHTVFVYMDHQYHLRLSMCLQLNVCLGPCLHS